MTDREKKIRDAAYRLWQEAGQPEGAGDRHWLEAEKMIHDAEETAASARKPKRTAKAEAPLASADKKPAKRASPEKNAAAAASAVAKALPKTDGKPARGKTPASVAEEPPVSVAGPAAATAAKRVGKSAGGKTQPGLTPAEIAMANGGGKSAKSQKPDAKR